MRRLLLMAPCLALMAGCGAPSDGGSDEIVDARPALAAVTIAPTRRVVAPQPRSLPGRPRVTLTPIAADQVPAFVEDGAGGTMEPAWPVAVDIERPGPARGLDPVLQVGDRLYHDYRYTEFEVIRFVVPDASLIPDDAEIALHHGDDGAGVVLRAGTR